ncbi:uncharacterized protein LOC129568165 [Sitodiplosis mosellana]|uniref:uncharacterized protein LOC129568165 n=1 Tax=Sitodiplosis mosellana TaxID=263140 RepID=UPI0024442774|nr:uncharacterized protein LOC129568165 [Sitodiplosis mosellana]
MFGASVLLRWVSRDLKIKKEYEKRRRDEKIKQYEVENQTVYDEIDGKIESIDSKTPFIYRFIEYWAFLECLGWIVILFAKREVDFPENFLYGICDEDCEGAISKAIIIKLVVTVLLVIGCKIKFTIFMLPWFLVNVSGIFAAWEVAVSAFWEYRDLNTRLLTVEKLWKSQQ